MMPFTSPVSSTVSIFTIVVAAFFSTTSVHAQSTMSSGGTLASRPIPVQCPLCGPGTDWTSIRNPGNTFTMSNGISMSCYYLQATVQDVNPNAAYAQEAQGCAHARHQAATNGCLCPNNNAFLTGILNDFTDLNGPCDLCGGGSVPNSNFGTTVTTSSMGTLNCKGLEDAMAGGVVSSTMCPVLKRDAASTCCNAGSSGGAGTPSMNTGPSIAYNNAAPVTSKPVYNTATQSSGTGGGRTSINHGHGGAGRDRDREAVLQQTNNRGALRGRRIESN